MIYFVPRLLGKSKNLILFYLMDNNVIFFKCIISGEPFSKPNQSFDQSLEIKTLKGIFFILQETFS